MRWRWRTYEIMVKKMEAEVVHKELEISTWRRKLAELVSENSSSEKNLYASGQQWRSSSRRTGHRHAGERVIHG
ncbi:hypothetical protein NL676_024113 [Syzygium grande]|nr:hypothetical protein NL676_024113 [Syzygium grande]